MLAFPLGKLVATPAALALNIDFGPFLNRHHHGDWGDLDPEDWQSNETALTEGTRLFSSYRTPQGLLWIITEADRSSTCVLLSSDY
jgi:streptogramin lyase